jgi:hypothetical protein
MKKTFQLIALRQQIIASALAHSIANEFGLFNTWCIENRQPVCHCNIKANAESKSNPSNLMASLLGIHLN